MEEGDSAFNQNETVTLSVDMSEQWASLPFPVINSVALALKRTRRWRLDGRSLRLLNRHWSTAISLGVTEIRPHPRRALVNRDVTSLWKFARATSLDMTPFLVDPLNDVRSGRSTHGRIWFGHHYDRQLEKVVDRLCRLPNLSRIEIGHRALMTCDPLRTDVREQWSRLTGITSLYCYGTENLKLFGDSLRNTTSMFYGGMYTSVARCLEELVHQMPQLDTLEIEASILSSDTKLDFLGKVSHVILHGVNDEKSSMPLSIQPATISSMTFSESAGSELHRFPLLDDLNCLRLMSDTGAVLNCLPFILVLQRLKVLEISASEVEDDVALPDEIFKFFKHLQHLSLESCIFNGAALRGNLPVLRGLRIHRSTVKDGDTTFMTTLHELELLLWEQVVCQNRQWLSIPLEEPMLPKLRSLSIDPILDDSVLMSLSSRTNLEVLSVGMDSEDVVSGDIADGVSALDNLQNLRILRIDGNGSRQNTMCSHVLSLCLITKLEQLWLGLSLDEFNKHKEKIEYIKCKAPHLIVEIGKQPESFPAYLFRHACFLRSCQMQTPASPRTQRTADGSML